MAQAFEYYTLFCACDLLSLDLLCPLTMAAVDAPCQVSASKLRRSRAVKTKQKLYDMAHRSDSLQQVQCQLAMLTSTVNNLVLVLSKSDVDFCMSSMPYPMGSTVWNPNQCAYFPEAYEASSPRETDLSAEEGCAGTAERCENPLTRSAAGHTDCQRHVHEPQAFVFVVDASTPVSKPSIITSRSVADIIDQLDQGLVRAVDFYDSCKTLVAEMVDGQTQAISNVPKDSLPQVVAKLRVNKVFMKSHFAKQFEAPADQENVANIEDITQASPGSTNYPADPAEDPDWKFLEQQLELCLKPMADLFGTMEPVRVNREDVLDDFVEAGISAIQAAMKSDHTRHLMKSYESRVRSSVRCHISSMMP